MLQRSDTGVDAAQLTRFSGNQSLEFDEFYVFLQSGNNNRLLFLLVIIIYSLFVSVPANHSSSAETNCGVVHAS